MPATGLYSRLSPNSQALVAQGLGSVAPSATAGSLSDDDKLTLFEEALAAAELANSTDSITSATPSTSVVTQPIADVATDSITQSTSSLTDATTQPDYTVLPQVLPQAVEESWRAAEATAAQAAAQGGRPEAKQAATTWNLENAIQESGGTLQSVEAESSLEISPEVESFLEEVKDAQTTPAQTIEEMAPAVTTPPAATQTETVRVLPITKAQEKTGEKKSPKFGIRWLVEFSRKIMKMFKGKVVYKNSVPTT